MPVLGTASTTCFLFRGDKDVDGRDIQHAKTRGTCHRGALSADPLALLRGHDVQIKKRRGFPRRFCVCWILRRFQRRSCRTFCCDWLASASAEVAIDWRVDSAWLLAAS